MGRQHTCAVTFRRNQSRPARAHLAPGASAARADAPDAPDAPDTPDARRRALAQQREGNLPHGRQAGR